MFPVLVGLVAEELPGITLLHIQVVLALRAKAMLVVALMAFLATIPLVAAVEPVLLGNLHQASPTLLAAQAALVWQAAFPVHQPTTLEAVVGAYQIALAGRQVEQVVLVAAVLLVCTTVMERTTVAVLLVQQTLAAVAVELSAHLWGVLVVPVWSSSVTLVHNVGRAVQ
jgi:hypothetical protein